MSVALIADAHLIAPDAPSEQRRTYRSHFAKAWPSFDEMITRLNEEAVDHVIILGDLIDYYTAENRDFALERLEALDAQWHLTLGNHDIEMLSKNTDKRTEVVRASDRAKAGWEDANVTYENRILDIGDARFLLVESASSAVPESTKAWLDAKLATDRQCILCTHVPLDTPEVAEAIIDVDPDRDLNKYVQRGSPNLFEDHLKGRIDAVFSGHLHFPAEVELDGCSQHILSPCVHAVGRTYPEQGMGVLLQASSPTAANWFRTSTASQE